MVYSQYIHYKQNGSSPVNYLHYTKYTVIYYHTRTTKVKKDK